MAQSDLGSYTLVYGAGFTVELPVGGTCESPTITISVDEPAVAVQLMDQSAILQVLQENYRLGRLLVNEYASLVCRRLFSGEGIISIMHGNTKLAQLSFENRGREPSDYQIIQPLSIMDQPFENDHFRLIWSKGDLRSSREIISALEASKDPFALHILATHKASGTRVLDLSLGDPQRVDGPELDRAVALGYPPSMVLKARILLQQNSLDTSNALQAGDPKLLNRIRALVNGALEQGSFSALLLRKALLDLDFDLTEADALARVAKARDQRTKAAIRAAMISLFHANCDSAEMRALVAATGGLFKGVPRQDGCRIQTAFGFYADLGFSDIRLKGCNGNTCRFETVNQCYARGSILWETCGDHIDHPWTGTYRLNSQQKPIEITRMN